MPPIGLIFALVFGLILVMSLYLNSIYRGFVLSVCCLYRTEPYIQQQQIFRRRVSPYALPLGFMGLSTWSIIQWPWYSLSSYDLILGGCLIIALAIVCLITVIDYKVQLIPTILVILLAIVILLAVAISTERSVSESVLRSLIYYVALRGLIFGLSLLNQAQGLGQGDINLLSVLGLWFDIYSCLQLIILASGLGLVYIFTQNYLNPHKPALRVIAFGPWIVCASLLILQINEIASW